MESYLFHWSPDHQSIAYKMNPTQEGEARAGVWVFDRNGRPRQIFRGWIAWYAWGPGNEIYFIQKSQTCKACFGTLTGMAVISRAFL